MSYRKLNSVRGKQALMPSASAAERNDSALKLRMEVDKLALLLEQVKRQSDRVQEAADAMGLRLLPDSHLEAALSPSTREWFTTKPALVRNLGNS